MTNHKTGAHEPICTYLSRQEAADYLSKHHAFGSMYQLEQLAREAKGPVYYRLGNQTLYKSSDLELWVSTNEPRGKRSSNEGTR
jgi:hypothetical protein